MISRRIPTDPILLASLQSPRGGWLARNRTGRGGFASVANQRLRETSDTFKYDPATDEDLDEEVKVDPEVEVAEDIDLDADLEIEDEAEEGEAEEAEEAAPEV